MANEYDRGVYESSLVPEGKVYIFDDQTYYYKDAEAEGKDFSLTVNNRFFESSMDFKVDKCRSREEFIAVIEFQDDYLFLFHINTVECSDSVP